MVNASIKTQPAIMLMRILIAASGCRAVASMAADTARPSARADPNAVAATMRGMATANIALYCSGPSVMLPPLPCGVVTMRARDRSGALLGARRDGRHAAA